MSAKGVLFRLWVIGSLLDDGIFCHAFEGAEHRDWMMSLYSLCHAIITGELSMPSLVELVSNIVRVWPLTVVYLKETVRKTDGDSLVV